ncbi:16S rRNA (uracil(1498)-N(3))-methyltransferase [Salimicrobium jeotgali]|nr:16S rRNA (uracil(1498)-N(3))-methyltransferase [Salimicrobium jeotgali]
MMQRYFAGRENWNEDRVKITGPDVHHIRKVMRMAPGDTVIVVHPDKKAFEAEITEIDEEVYCALKHPLETDPELPQKVTIVQAIGKSDKVEWVVQKGTELGMAEMIPFQAGRSVAKWDEKRQQKKVERWNKIAKEAAEQSERLMIPEVKSVASLKQVIEWTEGFGHLLFAYENEAREETESRLSGYIRKVGPGESVCLVIGPEGGFTPEEVSVLYQASFQPVRLGRRILRMETAALYFLSALSYEWEE